MLVVRFNNCLQRYEIFFFLQNILAMFFTQKILTFQDFRTTKTITPICKSNAFSAKSNAFIP